ncbi:MAG: iron ABC transporter permease [Firmicutes bacterium]|nr:iron ABC transporter permease [Bacillota bacterium]
MGTRRSRQAARLILLAGLLLAAVLIGTALGSVPLTLADVARSLAHPPWVGGGRAQTGAAAIVWDLRLPRVALAALVGAGLSLAGAGFQGLFRNPLADPFILGISSGGALGAALAIIASMQFHWLGVQAIPIAAFLASLLTVGLVYGLARAPGRLSSLNLILAGVAVSAFLSAALAFLISVSSDPVQKAISFWLVGGFSSASWRHVAMAGPYVGAGALTLLLLGRDINLLSLGEETAQQLGVRLAAVQLWLVVAASLATAASVAVTGVIGFVGLVMPHLTRLWVGPDHRWLLPASALSGAVFLVLADTLGRTLFSPLEVRVGIITGLVGGPFFLYLLRRNLRGGVSG